MTKAQEEKNKKSAEQQKKDTKENKRQALKKEIEDGCNIILNILDSIQ